MVSYCSNAQGGKHLHLILGNYKQRGGKKLKPNWAHSKMFGNGHKKSPFSRVNENVLGQHPYPTPTTWSEPAESWWLYSLLSNAQYLEI